MKALLSEVFTSNAESMFAVNTYEMLGNGKWFSLYFDNLPDLYNSKPPLMCWLQALCVKIAGYNETALRLPSAIAACLSIIDNIGKAELLQIQDKR